MVSSRELRLAKASPSECSLPEGSRSWRVVAATPQLLCALLCSLCPYLSRLAEHNAYSATGTLQALPAPFQGWIRSPCEG
jgi:hypothetical protein